MEQNSLGLGSAKEIIVKNFENWTSGNKKIDNFIQEKQLKYNETGDVFEWIPHSEIIDIKEIGDKYLTTAIWKEGPLHYDKNENKLIRKSNRKVVLRYLHNSRDGQDATIGDIANKVDSYLKDFQDYELSQNLLRSYGLYQNSYQDYRLSQNLLRDYNPYRGYGLSQNPDTNDYILVFSNNYLDYYCEKCGNECRKNIDDKQCIPCQVNHFKNKWTSGNEIIDNFIQKKQSNYNKYDVTSYNMFAIKAKEKQSVFEWIPYDEFINIKEIGDKCLTTAMWKEGPLHYDKDENELIRGLNGKVVLRYLHNLRDTKEIINKVESYLKDVLSQNAYQDYGSQNAYQDYGSQNAYQVYGLSQNPDTYDYILIFDNVYLNYYCEKCGNTYKNMDDKPCMPCQVNHLKNNWTSGNEIIDNFIQEKQSKYNEIGAVFEWIPYSEFIDIKKIGDKCLITAMWKGGPLQYDKDEIELIRKSNEKVVLRYLHNSQDTREIINKVESYFQAYRLSQKYGLSHNSDTNDYIFVFNNNYLDYCCEKCGNEYRKNTDDKQCIPCQINCLKNNWSGNEIIDNFIGMKQSKYNDDDAVFEWILYSEFIDIKEIGNKCLTTAMWKEGPLYYDKDKNILIRKSNEKVILRYLHNSQDTREIMIKVESYLKDELSQIPYRKYGLSQNPDTNDYILIFSNIYLYYYCEKCGNKYEKNTNDKWCKPCQINHLKNNFTNWTSKNEIIDDFIQGRQLNYNKNDVIFEWIPYSEFIDIKEIGDKYLTTAIWKEGPLHYDKDENELIRKSNEKVVLRYLRGLQDAREIINKVESYSPAYRLFQNPYQDYGLSQNPDTNDYILIFSNNCLDYCCEKCGNKYRKNTEDKQCISCQVNHLKNNWTSGNKIIDNFVQEKQTEYNENDAVFEWIPYSGFIDIKKIGDKCLITAMWKGGPLQYDKDEIELIRKSNEKVVLRYLHNLRDTREIINKVESYSQANRLSQNAYQDYGLSQNPDTNDYILVFSNNYLDYYCEKCGNEYGNYMDDKQCIPCQLNHLKNSWTSGNEIINNFIQEKQTKYNENDAVFEWIPYSEFINIKEIGDKCLTTAIWKEGPLHYDKDENELIRKSYEKVVLRYLHNLQDAREIIYKVKSYLKDKIQGYKFSRITEFTYQSLGQFSHQDSGSRLNQGYGLSRNLDTNIYILIFSNIYLDYYCEKCGNKYENNMNYKWCKPCLINNFTNWTSKNEIIDDFIQGRQLNYSDNNIIFEWIPYSEFINIKEIGDKCLTTAIWKEGPLHYNKDENKLIRNSYEKVVLRYLHKSRDDITEGIINKVKSYLKDELFQNRYQDYDLPQNPDQVYGLSQNPDTNDYILVFSNIYLDYYCEKCGKKYEKNMDYKWCKLCLLNHLKNNFTIRTSENKIIDNFIQERQLNCNKTDAVFEWISYSELIDIKEIGDKCLTTAIWKEGPLHYNKDKNKLTRNSYEKVVLRYLYNSQDAITEEIINKVESYLKDVLSQNPYQVYSLSQNPYQVYGLSQNPDTNDYILVFSNGHLYYYCKKCGNSGNERIDDFIQKKQLKCNRYVGYNGNNTVFEWISYDRLIDVKEIRIGDFAMAIWKDGPLYYSNRKWKRKLNEKVILKYLCSSQNINNEFLNKIMYLMENSYGISQNPNTNKYILVYKVGYNCENCGEKYNNKFEIDNKSCVTCQTNHENKKINDLIQEMKLNIDYNSSESNIMFEWIPYNQFYDIKKIGKGGFSTIYSAIWKNGLLIYNDFIHNSTGWKRKSNTNVALKCLHNSQKFIDEFINEVKAYPKQKIDNILKIYGISQNPNTKDYIMVLEYAEGGNFNNYLDKNYENFDWINGLKVLANIISGLSKLHQKQMVHCDFHIGNILFINNSNPSFITIAPLHENPYNACIADMGLCKKIDDIDETSIYGVMPYVAPEILRGKPYTQAADIYSFGMIMYFVATGRQPFSNYAHDEILVLNICNGIRPEINEKIAPKCYIDLMKKCWDLDPDSRPNSIIIKELITLFYDSLKPYHYAFKKEKQHFEIEKQFKETQENRKVNLLKIKNNQFITHEQAIYTSRLLNPFTKILLKYDDNIDNNTVEITDFTNC
ncbi:unnamed protein product [Rhizophagus irregularis]|nr:unnamed protein product [Rhizophagus irregularis]